MNSGTSYLKGHDTAMIKHSVTQVAFTVLCSVWFILTTALAIGAEAAATPKASAPSPVVMVLGDSLSAAYGIDADAGWVRLLQQALATQYPQST